MNKSKMVVSELRYLAAQTISNAGSGHTGISLGAAPIFYSVYTGGLKYSPSCPDYFNRDRFVLCAGHSSALYYACMHAFGFPYSKEDLINYRKKGSKTKGHPSADPSLGIDASGGPLGQGIPMAVGMAIAEKKLAARFNKPGYNIIDHHTIVFAGDGSLMEGVTGEASSLAGTLKLNKLIILYDSNNITIEGSTDIAFTENVIARYKAYGWNTMEVEDGENPDSIIAAINLAKTSTHKPTFIKINTKIGFATPYEGQAKIHGKALTAEELLATKNKLGVNLEPFELSEETQGLLKAIKLQKEAQIAKEEALLRDYAVKYKSDYEELVRWLNDDYSKKVDYTKLQPQDGVEATRNSSKYILNKLAEQIPNLLSGSADLAPSVGTRLENMGDFSAIDVHGRNLHFGVREHAMAAISNGIALHGGFRVVASTFMVFSDYMRHAVRMSSLMKLPVIYVLSHDSIGVGEDGKTHQPVEFNAMYRAMPDLNFIRPADRCETMFAYKTALESNLPTVIALTRQNTTNLASYTSSESQMGAYFVVKHRNPDAIIYSCGSELSIAISASKKLALKRIKASVVSVPSTTIFERQNSGYKDAILRKDIPVRATIEASKDDGWYKFAGLDGVVIGTSTYGFTASGEELYEHFKITSKNLVEQILNKIK